jgi:GNAT superfamily N-acetyltransferase
MRSELRVVAVTDDKGALIAADWLAAALPVHRQLRPQLPENYARRMSEIFAGGGRMAVVVDGDALVCVAIWRIVENTADGRRLYVDDLVSDEHRRSQGAGKAMLAWLEAKARAHCCDVFALDSGVQRARAHHFYFREDFHISSFCFRKALQ